MIMPVNIDRLFFQVSLSVEVKMIPIKGRQVVLQFVLPEADIPDKVMVTESRSGVPMTPSVMFALLTVFTLGFSFYAAVRCVEAVQTPTVYTTKGLAVGKEF